MLPDTLGPLEEIARKLGEYNKRLEALERQRSGSNRLIDSVVLAAPAASIIFSNIPSIYDHLMILHYLRGDDPAVGSDSLFMRLNADVGANYDWIEGLIRLAGLITNEVLAGTSIRVALFPGGNAPANTFDTGRIRINNYANSSNHKSVFMQAGIKMGVATNTIFHSVASGWWRNTAPITSITLFGAVAGNDFDVGSRVDLYGIQGGQ